jgi:hypothetical protein
MCFYLENLSSLVYCLWLSGALERCFTLVGPGLTRKFYTKLKKHARYKHSCLLQALVNYDCKKSYNIRPQRGSEWGWLSTSSERKKYFEFFFLQLLQDFKIQWTTFRQVTLKIVHGGTAL